MKITVDAYALRPPSVMAGIQGSKGCESLSFEFDPLWEGYTKNIVFVMPNGEAIERRYRDEPLPIPEQVLCHRGKLRFGVVGKKGKRRRMSFMGELVVLHGPHGTQEESGKEARDGE